MTVSGYSYEMTLQNLSVLLIIRLRMVTRFNCAVFCLSVLSAVHGGTRVFSGGNATPGEPLFLTPYLDDGQLIAARTAAKVPSMLDGEHVESYAGYLTVNKQYNSNLFFWFFPAENNPNLAPLALWLQGGPGNSSLFGTLAENGPFVVGSDLKLRRRKHYWSQELNIIYLDNPVGTGFSFTDKYAGYADDVMDVGKDLYVAMTQFFDIFPEFRKNKFFLIGESYAGKFVTALAHTIHDNNPSADFKINLVGLAIGNGVIDPRNMFVYSDYLYQHGLIDDNAFTSLKEMENIAVSLIDQQKFREAAVLSQNIINMIRNVTGPLDIYDYTIVGVNNDTQNNIINYLKKPEVRKSLHVGDKQFNDGSVAADHLLEDSSKSIGPWFEQLLDQYRVMLYSGQFDIIVAYPLTLNFVKKLNWSGADEYKKAPRKMWYVENELAGYVKTVKNFTEVLVRNAGHMVPADQPVWALDLITRFTQNIPLDKPYSS